LFQGLAGLRQIHTLSCLKKKNPKEVEISAPQPLLLGLWLWEAALRFLIKLPHMEGEMAPAIKTHCCV